MLAKRLSAISAIGSLYRPKSSSSAGIPERPTHFTPNEGGYGGG
jgi:hypothetical protein